MIDRLFKPKKSLAEMEEESEHKEAEDRLAGYDLSIAQKREAASRLKERGLTPRHFNFDWRKIATWIKTH